jgi:hypothetical protein
MQLQMQALLESSVSQHMTVETAAQFSSQDFNVLAMSFRSLNDTGAL